MAVLKCKQCGGDLQPTSDTYVTCPYCNSTMLMSELTGGTSTVAPGIDALMKRGKLFLEDKHWEDADKYFDRALDINPEHSPAYIGKLCAQFEYESEKELSRYEYPYKTYRSNKHYQKALRFATPAYREVLDGYYNAWLEQKTKHEADKKAEEDKRRAENEERQRILAEKQAAVTVDETAPELSSENIDDEASSDDSINTPTPGFFARNKAPIIVGAIIVITIIAIIAFNIKPEPDQIEANNITYDESVIVALSEDDYAFYLYDKLAKAIKNDGYYSNAYLYSYQSTLFPDDINTNRYWRTIRGVSTGDTIEDIFSAYNGIDYEATGSDEYYDIIYSSEYGEIIFGMYNDLIESIEIKSSSFAYVEDEILKSNEAFQRVNIGLYAEGKFSINIRMDSNMVNIADFPIIAPDIINDVKAVLKSYNLADYQYSISVVDDSENIGIRCLWPAGHNLRIYRIENYENGVRVSENTELRYYGSREIYERD